MEKLPPTLEASKNPEACGLNNRATRAAWRKPDRTLSGSCLRALARRVRELPAIGRNAIAEGALEWQWRRGALFSAFPAAQAPHWTAIAVVDVVSLVGALAELLSPGMKAAAGGRAGRPCSQGRNAARSERPPGGPSAQRRGGARCA
jgi:hypothetical protein